MKDPTFTFSIPFGSYVSRLNVRHSFFVRIPSFCQAWMILSFSDFELRTILTLFLNIKGEASPKNLRNICQSLLMFYYIVKLGKSLYFVSVMQKYI